MTIKNRMRPRSLTRTTDATTEPLTVAEVKAHLRLDTTAGEPAPDSLTAALAGAGSGNVDDGVHAYLATFVTAAGETEGGAVSASVTTTSGDGQVSLSAIPLGGDAVTQRKIYRTEAGASTYKLLTTLADNTTTTYTDDTADSSLGAEVPASNSTLDPEINRLIKAGRKAAEKYMSRALLTQTWAARFDRFPVWTMYLSGISPVASITSIAYTDVDDAPQTLATGNYDVDIYSKPSRIVPSFGNAWPDVREGINRVVVTAVCGDTAAANVPQPIKQGIEMFVASHYDNRSDVVQGTNAALIPQTSRDLWDPYRIKEFV
tara:strand:- start:1745 stop:2698 length:954 start_codon:yes stop_codon:yes gene_type:complete